MIIISFVLLLPCVLLWLIIFVLKSKDKEKRTSTKEYAEAIVVGYESQRKYTGLTVRFQWNGLSVRCETDQVDRADFAIGSNVKISYYSEYLNRFLPNILNNDKISGIVNVESHKTKERNEKTSHSVEICMIVLAFILSTLTVTTFVVGILR